MKSILCSTCQKTSVLEQEQEVFCSYCRDSMVVSWVGDQPCCYHCSQTYGLCMSCGDFLIKN